MQLDPKGLEAARTAVADLCNTATEAVPMAHVEATVRAYLSAAPSPSPAPDVVEALKQAADRFEEIRLILVHHLHEPERSAFWKAVDGRTKCQAALAALSQPAKGEREAMFRVFLKSKDDDAAFTFATKPEMVAFLKANRATPNGWDITDIHEYQCSTAASAFNTLSEIEESVK